MTKLITIAIILIVAIGGWNFYQYWTKFSDEKQSARQEAVAAVSLDPRSLAGISEQMKNGLENSLEKAQRSGVPSLREWLKTYKKFVEDPRLAWVELDYCVLVARDNPAEAKRIFADVKDRTPPTSPIYPRIKLLEKTYE